MPSINSNKVADFSDTYALFGLVFNSLDIDQTKTRIRQAIAQRESLVFATPNVNFVAMAAADQPFAEVIRNCDLGLADGTPLFWLAKHIGIPLPERVAGSSLIESLRADKGHQPIKVYFFGGMDGVAEQAAAVLNQHPGGMIAVGASNPGFGSVESMSDEQTIAAINAAAPDFLIVSLSAKKGHQWIQHNRQRLSVPVMSHLGAVVNFVAGEQQRSPQLLQKTGLEWLWRIYQEPALYKRYGSDAIVLAKLLLGTYLPLYRLAKRYKTTLGNIDCVTDAAGTHIKLQGAIHDPLPMALLDALQNSYADPTRKLHLDFADTLYISHQFAACLLRISAKYQGWPQHITLANIAPPLQRLLALHQFEW